MALKILTQEKVWLDKARYVDAERIFYEKLSKVSKHERSIICSKHGTSSETINAITNLKNAYKKLDARVILLEGKSLYEEIKVRDKVLADICESKNIKKHQLNTSNKSKSKPKNMSECDNLSLCDQVNKYRKSNDINKMLSSIEQWDIKVPNQYKSINKFECLACYFKTNVFNDWKLHIMSISHMSDCHKANDLYSYVCSSKGCKVLLYGPEESLNIHRAKHLGNGSITGVPILMAEVMKRFNTKQNTMIHYCSHCKKYDEKPIHSNNTDIIKYIKCPVEYYCKYCRVQFFSSPEMVDYHSLSVEHLTLKCFDKLCLEAKMDFKKKKTSKLSNKTREKNLLSTVENEIITNSIPLQNVVQDISVLKNSDCIEVADNCMQNVQANESLTNMDVGSTILFDQKSLKKSLNTSVEESDINIHNISSGSYDTKSNHQKKCQQYTQYFKHKMDILNLLLQYKNYVLKTLAYYCNMCDFVTEEKYIWDMHTETEHLCAANIPTVHCSICSMMIVGWTYEEHSRTIEHCIILEFVQSLKSVIDDLVKNTDLMKFIDTSNLGETFVNSERNNQLDLIEVNNIESEILDNPNFQNNCHKNNDCILKIESNSKSKDLSITNMVSPDKSYVKSDELLNPVNSKTTSNKITDEKSQLDVTSAFGNVANLENEKTDELDEDKAYGEYVTQRLKNIKNATVKQDLQLEIDYLFYTKIKKSLQKNAL